MPDQFSMFASEPTYPDGFRYAPDVISRDDGRAIVEHVRALVTEYAPSAAPVTPDVPSCVIGPTPRY